MKLPFIALGFLLFDEILSMKITPPKGVLTNSLQD